MKIGIYIDILKNRKTGVEYYTENIIRHLIKIDKKNKYYLIKQEKDANIDIKEKPVPELIVLKQHFIIRLADCTINYLPERITRFLRRYIPLRSILKYYFSPEEKLNRLDILFSPTHTAPFKNKNHQYKVMTVHDITPILFPEFHNINSVLFHKTAFKEILYKSDMIAADSNSTKNDLIKHLKIPQKKIMRVHIGLNSHIKYTNNFRNVLEKYNIPEEFILYFGTLEPRKNVPAVINAFYKIKKAGFKETLVIAGGKGWDYNQIFRLVKKLNLEKEVIFTGYVDEKDVSMLYSAAKLFVYPSFYEGFGLPVLEAMTCRCPVITSQVSSLPEVTGDAAILINPNNTNQIANAMKNVLSSEKLKKQMIERGLIQAKKFTWEKAAENMLKIFEQGYKEKKAKKFKYSS